MLTLSPVMQTKEEMNRHCWLPQKRHADPGEESGEKKMDFIL